MFGGYRGPVYAIGLAATLAVAAGSGFWLYNDASQLERLYEHQAKQKTDYYVHRAHVAAKGRCARFAAPEKAHCIRQERDAARQGVHDEQDLKAQLITSIWTRYMGVAAIIGMAVGIFGVGLIFVTFRETRSATRAAGRMAFDTSVGVQAAVEANNEMREANAIAKSSQRPWLGVSLDLVGEAKFTPEGLHFEGYFVITNVGQTAALNVKIALATYDHFGLEIADLQRFADECRESAKADKSGFVIVPNEETRHYRGFQLLRESFPPRKPGKRRVVLPLVIVSVTYRREGSAEVLQTAKGIVIERLSQGMLGMGHVGMAFAIDCPDIDAERLRIRHAVGIAT